MGNHCLSLQSLPLQSPTSTTQRAACRVICTGSRIYSGSPAMWRIVLVTAPGNTLMAGRQQVFRLQRAIRFMIPGGRRSLCLAASELQQQGLFPAQTGQPVHFLPLMPVLAATVACHWWGCPHSPSRHCHQTFLFELKVTGVRLPFRNGCHCAARCGAPFASVAGLQARLCQMLSGCRDIPCRMLPDTHQLGQP